MSRVLSLDGLHNEGFIFGISADISKHFCEREKRIPQVIANVWVHFLNQGKRCCERLDIIDDRRGGLPRTRPHYRDS
jgi:hypothetical protein